ncbi:hypothetical protein GNI_140770 [Gregarina niphandrodes]|uniref:Leucine rich repeat protein n=1 Tax=Gregarina niphandrodes TaxID=110365 RepID=A0A023B130_GRENI|nr:hypothetical protein GNI_140770 [Gregarina niphandrodes]EZG45101.1 hypothetical protein GNI_140770 [Gregarina niphandrodes]|eukprot:XP_011132564.1 hypothetical protein GNI_140770 [Gregarina niphandrodes]
MPWITGWYPLERQLWFVGKQTHAHSYEALGVLSSELYLASYEKILLCGGLKEFVGEVPAEEGLEVETSWTVVVDASRSFLETIDVDELIRHLYLRVRTGLEGSWNQADERVSKYVQAILQSRCFDSLGQLRRNVTEICLTSSVLKTLPKVREVYPRLRTLLVNHGHITQLDCNQMTLTKNAPALELLDLRHNRIANIKPLKELLYNATKLQKLAPHSHKGNLSLRKATASSHILMLFLSCNQIAAVVDCLPDLPSLSILGLYSCNIDESLERVFASILSKAPNLRYLYMDGNPCFDINRASGKCLGQFQYGLSAGIAPPKLIFPVSRISSINP